MLSHTRSGKVEPVKSLKQLDWRLTPPKSLPPQLKTLTQFIILPSSSLVLRHTYHLCPVIPHTSNVNETSSSSSGSGDESGFGDGNGSGSGDAAGIKPSPFHPYDASMLTRTSHVTATLWAMAMATGTPQAMAMGTTWAMATAISISVMTPSPALQAK